MSEIHIPTQVSTRSTIKQVILSKNALFIVVLAFILPKLFGYFETIQLTPLERWIYIITTDLIPAVFILLWVRENTVKTESKKTESFRAYMDPLLFIRFCACLMVLLGHYFLVIFSPPSQSTDAGLIYRLVMSSPWAGVWIFFTLSGYLMGKGFFSGRYSFGEDGISKFYFNRATRIIPIYLLALTAQWIFLSPQIFLPENIWGIIQTVTMDQNQWVVVGALWSVITEFHFYLMAPFIAIAIHFIGSKLKIGFTAIVITIISGLCISVGLATFHNWDHTSVLLTIYKPLGANLFMFVSGMLLAKILSDKPVKRFHDWSWVGVPVFLITVLVMTLWISYTGYGKPIEALSRYWVYAPPVTVVGTLATIWIFETGKKIESGPVFYIIKATQYGGAITYCLYAFHSQIMEQIRKVAPAELMHHAELAYLPVAVALVWGISHFCYKVIEKPLSEVRR